MPREEMKYALIQLQAHDGLLLQLHVSLHFKNVHSVAKSQYQIVKIRP